MKSKLIITAAVVLLPIGVISTRADDAQSDWTKHCLKCHGAAGKGETRMGRQLRVKDYSDPKVQAEMKDEDMLRILRDGVKDGAKVKMEAYKDKLSEPEIKDLLALVRSFKK